MVRIVFITQDDPFYLAENLDYLFSNIPNGTSVVGCIVTRVSPFGGREPFLVKAKRTASIFGLRFFIRYGLDYLASKLPQRRSVREILKIHNIPELALNQTLNSPDSLAAISALSPDLLISIAGNEIFRKPLIELAPLGCLNLHTALLPKYRGLMPSFWVLKNGETTTGVSVFYVDEGIDSGPILVQERFDIGDMSQRELIKATKMLGMKAIIESIEKLRDGDTATLPNNDNESTYFSFPKREDVKEFRNVGARFF